AALETLGQASGEVAPFLLKYLGDSDPEVRAAAALALGTTESRVPANGQLLGMLQQETDPEVRQRLYQALRNQGEYDIRAIQALAQSEHEPAARLASLDLLAAACRQAPSTEALSFFDQTAVPELKDSAINGPELHLRLASVMALRRAQTPESLKA